MTVQVVYIGSSGRSGSTLLARMLARSPGYQSVGELDFLWERGLIRDDRCGCGERFHDCPFWKEVGSAGFGGWDQVDAAEAARLRASVVRHRKLHRLRRLRPEAEGAALPISRYAALTARLYRAVAEVSGASVLVDSSKQVGHLLVLRSVPDIDVRLVHLVRRSHGVAYSWTKRVRKPDVGDGTAFMSTHAAWWSMGLWMTDNILLEAIARSIRSTGGHSTRARYEDLVSDPKAELSRISRALSLPGGDSPDVGQIVSLELEHSLSGNPMRFESGEVQLRQDEEWRTMSPGKRTAISLATWPLLARYGYAGRGR